MKSGWDYVILILIGLLMVFNTLTSNSTFILFESFLLIGAVIAYVVERRKR